MRYLLLGLGIFFEKVLGIFIWGLEIADNLREIPILHNNYPPKNNIVDFDTLFFPLGASAYKNIYFFKKNVGIPNGT